MISAITRCTAAVLHRQPTSKASDESSLVQRIASGDQLAMRALFIPEATVKTRMFYARKRLGDLVMAA